MDRPTRFRRLPTSTLQTNAILVRLPHPVAGPLPAGWHDCSNGLMERRFRDPLAASVTLLALHRAPMRASQVATRLRELELAGGWKLMLHGQLPLLHEATLAVDAATLAKHPRMRVARILAMCKDDRLPQAKHAWAAFRRDQDKAARRMRLPPWELELLGEIVAGYAGHAPTRARLDDLRRLVREIPEGEPDARGACYNILLHAAVERGEFTDALPLADRALLEFRRAGSVFGELFIHLQRGLARFRGGHVQAASRDFEAALALGKNHFEADSVLIALPQALIGAAAYERGDLAAAAAALDTALPLIELEEGWTEPLWLIYRTATALALQRSTPQAAFAQLGRAQKRARLRGLVRLEALLGLHELDLAMRLRQKEHAARVAAQLRLGELATRNDHATPAWRETVLHARLAHLLHGRRSDPGEFALLAQECRNAQLPHLLCRVLILHASADAAASANLMKEAIHHLSAQRVWSSVIDAPGISAAWSRLPRKALRSLSMTQRGTVRAFSAAVRASQKTLVLGSDVMLISPGEQRVLQALAEGLRNKEIARRLGRSENTVKFHLKQLARKFGVSRRQEVFEQAKALGLIDLP